MNFHQREKYDYAALFVNIFISLSFRQDALSSCFDNFFLSFHLGELISNIFVWNTH